MSDHNNKIKTKKGLSMIVIALFFPPIYFLMRNKIGLGLISGFSLVGGLGLLVVALPLFFLIIPAIFIAWFIFSCIAVVQCRQEENQKTLDRHAQMVAQQIRQEFIANIPKPPVIPSSEPQRAA